MSKDDSRYIIISEGGTHTWDGDKFCKGFDPYLAITFTRKRDVFRESFIIIDYPKHFR